MRPIVHGLEAAYGNCIDFVYLDIDNSANTDAMRQYKFQAQPLVILLDGSGQELWRQFGRMSREQLEVKLKTALPK